MTVTNTNQSPAGGDVEAREAAKRAVISYAFEACQPNNGSVFGWIDDHANEIRDAAIDAYLAKLTSTKPEPSRIADLVKRLRSPSGIGEPLDHAAMSEAATIITAIEADKASLFGAIQHGDDEHKIWLKQAIADHFAGKAVEPPRGKGNKEARIAELEADRGRMREALEEVCNPLGKLTRDAKSAGAKLNNAAYGIANNLSFVQGIARAALNPSKPGEG